MKKLPDNIIEYLVEKFSVSRQAVHYRIKHPISYHSQIKRQERNEAIRKDFEKGVKVKDLVEKYGKRKSQIYNILKLKT